MRRALSVSLAVVLLTLPATAAATSINRPQAEHELRRAIRYDCTHQFFHCKRWYARECTQFSKVKVACNVKEEFTRRGNLRSTCYFRMSIRLNVKRWEYHFHESNDHCYAPNGETVDS